MKHVIPAVLIVLCLASFGHAAEWRPFVGFGGGGEFVAPLSNLKLPNKGNGLFPSFAYAATVRAGVAHGDWNLHAGYHFEDALTVRYDEGWYAYVNGLFSESHDQNWKVSWMEFGGRWIPQTVRPRRVAPIVGAAVVISDTKLVQETTHVRQPYGGEIQFYDITKSTRKSATDLGFLMEFGFRIEASRTLSLDILSRVHRYEAEFRPSPEEPHLDHFVTLVSGYEIGLNWKPPLAIR